MRPELEPLPAKMTTLPLDARGYPVPWFVAWHDGVPEFRAMDPAKWTRAVRERRCWVCGGILGRHLAFVIGPMCGLNRTTSEPPCHLDCAEWSARNCPFLARPHMIRREDEASNAALHAVQSDGTAILRNPGVTLIWITRTYRKFRTGQKWLITVGDPERLIWYARGRLATRAEVAASIASGLPLLMEVAVKQDADEPGAGAVAMLTRQHAAFERDHLAALPSQETP